MCQDGFCAGNEFSGATAFAECFADVFATVFAKAAAEAAATAQCFDNGGDAAATAFILAEVEAEVYGYEACYIGVEETGTSTGSIGNSFAGTFVVCSPGCVSLLICARVCVSSTVYPSTGQQQQYGAQNAV